MTITAEELVRREVHYCVSSLVHTLAQGYRQPFGAHSTNLSDLCEQAMDLAAPVDDFEEAAREAGWKPDNSTGNTNWYNDNFVSSAAEAMHNARQPHEGEAREYVDDVCAVYVSAKAVCDAESIEPHQREVFEHWIVSEWLADRLAEKGEKIDKDFAGMVVWARTTTGQAISIDGVIEEIHAELIARHTA